MSNDNQTPFERAVTQIASKQPELQPKPFKPEMRSDRMWYELQAARAKCAEFRVLLADIAEHLSHGAALHAGSLIFEEDAPAIEVISKAIAKD